MPHLPTVNFQPADYLEAGRRVLRLEIDELTRMESRLGASFSQAIVLMLECVSRRGKLVVCGVGKSGHIGEKIAATLTSTGCPAVVLNCLNAVHGDLGVVSDGDLILALSYSGETDELVNVLPSLARFDVKVISMTGNPKSSVALNSHVHIEVRVEQEACPLRLAPTSSTTVMLAVGDALAMVLLEARGFTKEDFAKFHPGGRLGRTLLLKVDQIMRGIDQIALVSPAMVVREVLQKMTQRRAGAAVAVEENGCLAGIFTHGDFARYFQSNPGIGEMAVSQFLTRKPVTVESGHLAVEVLSILEKHRIDDLVVLDASGCPVGVVDSQDLARHRLV